MTRQCMRMDRHVASRIELSNQCRKRDNTPALPLICRFTPAAWSGALPRRAGRPVYRRQPLSAAQRAPPSLK